MIQSIEAKEKVNQQQKKIHPHKFIMWIAIASIIMMFAGFTSAYIVKREQPGWTTFDMPKAFWYSTAVILLSSITMQSALKAFKGREMLKYKNLLTLTALLGVLFMVLQILGFQHIWKSGITFSGAGAGQFLYVIAGLHVLHVLGGVIALIFMFFKAYNTKVRNYNSVPVEVVSTYWHFVDLLWIYLLIFFVAIH